jgi:hypothetical protein
MLHPDYAAFLAGKAPKPQAVGIEPARAEAVGALVAAEPGEAWVIWCDNDAEADALRAAVPGAVEVRGSHTPDRKEEALAAFAAGQARYRSPGAGAVAGAARHRRGISDCRAEADGD